jgi:hypothetical protein
LCQRNVSRRPRVSPSDYARRTGARKPTDSTDQCCQLPPLVEPEKKPYLLASASKSSTHADKTFHPSSSRLQYWTRCLRQNSQVLPYTGTSDRRSFSTALCLSDGPPHVPVQSSTTTTTYSAPHFIGSVPDNSIQLNPTRNFLPLNPVSVLVARK